MRKIVCNTTPILSLIKINRLELLYQLYEQITIPVAVYNEIEEGKSKLHYVNLKSMNWFNVEEIKNKNSIQDFVLDAGEAEVIQLALEQNADLVIIDESAGREIAQQNKLKLTGTIGILLKAKDKGYIESLKPELDKLMDQGIWISKKLYNKSLNIAHEI